MSNRNIILSFAAVTVLFLVTVALWPMSQPSDEKTARLSGPPVETAFMPERFGVPTTVR